MIKTLRLQTRYLLLKDPDYRMAFEHDENLEVDFADNYGISYKSKVFPQQLTSKEEPEKLMSIKVPPIFQKLRQKRLKNKRELPYYSGND